MTGYRPPQISVALATFNGEKHLEQQLESLANQIMPPMELIVSDDGSTDNTIKIIESFSKQCTFPVIIHKNEKRLGFSDNFLKAARMCSGDWVAFCDQDDFWLPNRLEASAKAIAHNPTAVLILQNAYICDSKLKQTKRAAFPNKLRPGKYKPGSLPGFFVWPGFLQTISSKIICMEGRDNRPSHFFSGYSVQTHDAWTCMMANSIGDTIIQPEIVSLYRRHSHTVTKLDVANNLRNRILTSKTVGAEDYSNRSRVASESADYLEATASHLNNGPLQTKIIESASRYHHLSKMLASRAEIYSSTTRQSAFLALIRHGVGHGYFGKRFFSAGIRALCKDITLTVLRVGFQR